MNVKLIVIAAVGLLAISATTALADPCGSNTLGANVVVVPANTDVLVSVPYVRASEGSWTVDTVTGDGVTVSGGLPTLTSGMYYVRFTDGGAEGRWTTITSNTSTDIVFEDDSFLGDISSNDGFCIYAHQTLESVFPDNLKDVGGSIAGAFKESSSPFAPATKVLLPDTDSVGTNKPSAATYYFYNDAWRKIGAGSTLSFDETVIDPDTYFTIRNDSGDDLNFVSGGIIPATDNVRLTIVRSVPIASQENDVLFGLGRGVAMKLADLDLGGSPAFKTTTSLFQPQDRLVTYDNAQTGLNKPSVATYYYYNDAWRKVGESAAQSFDDALIPAGSALIIRKVSGTPGTVEWVMTP